jgi:hypothetical protein
LNGAADAGLNYSPVGWIEAEQSPDRTSIVGWFHPRLSPFI